MKINSFLIRWGIIIFIIFGGTFAIRIAEGKELTFDLLVGAFVGLLLILCSIIWRLGKNNQFSR